MCPIQAQEAYTKVRSICIQMGFWDGVILTKSKWKVGARWGRWRLYVGSERPHDKGGQRKQAKMQYDSADILDGAESLMTADNVKAGGLVLH
jgi:hypothetical protein